MTQDRNEIQAMRLATDAGAGEEGKLITRTSPMN